MACLRIKKVQWVHRAKATAKATMSKPYGNPRMTNPTETSSSGAAPTYTRSIITTQRGGIGAKGNKVGRGHNARRRGRGAMSSQSNSNVLNAGPEVDTQESSA
ncbi:conserved hypothetical protein [Ricinus communis]|uniref:Uncharacterized protein n=1 Tax=Ricinus communis TaxID=3988 RepID=B9T182_RICCO|nr:conserved hypothetical protein [Ricinus communis]